MPCTTCSTAVPSKIQSAASTLLRITGAALYSIARSDILAQTPVDGVAIGDIKSGGADAVSAFLAEQLRTNAYRPFPLRRVHIPKPGEGRSDAPGSSDPGRPGLNVIELHRHELAACPLR